MSDVKAEADEFDPNAETKILPAIGTMAAAFDCRIVSETEPGKQYCPIGDGKFVEIVAKKSTEQLKGMAFEGKAVYATPLKAAPGQPGFWISIVADANGQPTKEGSIVVENGDGYVAPVEGGK